MVFDSRVYGVFEERLKEVLEKAAVVWESHRREALARLRQHMRDRLRRLVEENSSEWGSDLTTALLRWAESATVEGLAEHMDSGGWTEAETSDDLAGRLQVAWGCLARHAETGNFDCWLPIPRYKRSDADVVVTVVNPGWRNPPTPEDLEPYRLRDEGPLWDTAPERVTVETKHGAAALRALFDAGDWLELEFGIVERCDWPECPHCADMVQWSNSDWLRWLAGGWLEKVKADTEAELAKEREYTPALANPVLNRLVEMTSASTTTEGGLIRSPRGRHLAEYEATETERTLRIARVITPNMTDVVLDQVLNDCLVALRSLAGHRLIRYVVREGAKKLGNGAGDVARIAVVGGFQALQKDVGLSTTPKASRQLRDALAALSVLKIASPDDGLASAWLLQFEEWRQGPGTAARLEITLNWPLLPTGASKLKGTERRNLIPVLTLPKLVGRNNEHAAQSVFQFRLLQHFSEHAAELAERGGLVLANPVWYRLADDSQVPKATVPELQRVYRSGGGELFRMLIPADGRRETLADPGARDLLTRQGQKAIEGKKRRKGR